MLDPTSKSDDSEDLRAKKKKIAESTLKKKKRYGEIQRLSVFFVSCRHLFHNMNHNKSGTFRHPNISHRYSTASL